MGDGSGMDWGGLGLLIRVPNKGGLLIGASNEALYKGSFFGHPWDEAG